MTNEQPLEDDKYLDVKTLTGSLVEEQQQRLQHTPSTRSHNSNTSIGKLLDMAKKTDAFQAINKEAVQDKKRLSMMMQSLQANDQETVISFEDADDVIINRSPESVQQRSPVVTHQVSYSDVNLASDTNYHSANQSIDSFDFELPDNQISRQNTTSTRRKSYISDYTPSIHEAKEIQVVNRESSSSILEGVKRDFSNDKQKPEQLLKRVVDRSQENLNSNESTVSIVSEASKYPASVYSKPEVESSPYMVRQNLHDRQRSKGSSIDIPLGGLKTKTSNTILPQDTTRTETTDLNPSIPSRSPRRPTSTTATELRERLRKRRPHSVEITAMDDLLSELNEEVSGPSSEVGVPPEPLTVHKQQDSQSSSQYKDASMTPRPLPPPPVPTHKVKQSVTSTITFEEPITSPRTNDDKAQEDGFITEEEEEEEEEILEEEKQPKDPKKSKRRSVKSTRSRHSHAKSSITLNTTTTGRRSMNHETLLKLLQVTEGTIIGQEFQDLGLADSEKQLLERLVDSLSRLTADMIIDGERKNESIKRLNRAIKALEGF